MNYVRIDTCDTTNGAGVGVVLWVQGCDVHCKGCHNPSTWSFSDGQLFNSETMKALKNALKKPYISRLTLSGGHPLAPQNASDIYEIIKEVKQEFPNIKVWLYTGYTLEYAMQSYSNILALCDVVVDGPYIESLRNIALKFRGSENQRIIDMNETRKAGKIVLWDK